MMIRFRSSIRRAQARTAPVLRSLFISPRSHGLALALLTLVGIAGSGGAHTPASIRVLASDAKGVTLEYTAPALVVRTRDTALGTFQELKLEEHLAAPHLGRPLLPGLGVPLAIPEGTEGRATWQVMESEQLDGITPLPAAEGIAAADARIRRDGSTVIDDAAYAPGGGPTSGEDDHVFFEIRGRLRDHRVGQLSIQPFRYEAGTGRVTFLRRLRIRIDFVPQRAAAAGTVSPGEMIPVGVDRAWETTYEGVFVNYEAARQFRRRPLPGRERALPRGDRLEELGTSRIGSVGANPCFKVRVGVTGAYYIGAADLRAEGWPDTVPTGQIRLFERSLNASDPAAPLEREIPITIEDYSGVTGRFDADDYIVFYGLNYRDRFNAVDPDARYTYFHNYWLSWRTEGGARMPRPAGWAPDGSFTTPTSFQARTRFEQNRTYIYFPPTTNLDYPTSESFYWFDGNSGRDSLEFATPGRDPSGVFRVRARWQGVYINVHYLSCWVSRGAMDDTLLFFRRQIGSGQEYVFDSASPANPGGALTLPASRLNDGVNLFKLQGERPTFEDPFSPGSGAWFDWVEITYPRRYVAANGLLRFTSGAARGDVEFVVGGLGATLPYVFDVTDSLAPTQIDLSAAQFVSQGGRPPVYQLTFRVNVDRQRTYWLISPDNLPSITTAGRVPVDIGGRNIVRDDVDLDVTADTGADVLLLAPTSMQPALAPWVAHRQSQGYQVRVVSPQDVWDQFSGGDKNIPALRTWLRFVYRNWSDPPDYLVLGGDGSEDYRKDLGSSDPDVVPTMMLYGPVPGADQRKELIGSDNYFVGALAVGDNERDIFPEIHVGRLPATTPAEMTTLVDKLIAYDTYTPDDTWRNRAMLMADDQYSSGITSNASYCYKGTGETGFERAADSTCAVLLRDSCFTDFQCDVFKIGPFFDGNPALGRNVAGRDQNPLAECPPIGPHVQYAKSAVSPAWVEMASKGHLFMLYGGHANRLVMGTEQFVEYNGSFTSPEYRTPDLLTNTGKPFIFIGAACHLNEFEHYTEATFKHALAEAMVMSPSKGAIASIASTGYEWVFTNMPTEVYLARAMFGDHPRDPVTGKPRSVLGEGFDEGLCRMVLGIIGSKNVPSGYRDTFITYCILGDPTMRIDMAPPKLQVEVNGAAVGTPAVITPPEGQTVAAITARLSDDVTTDRLDLTDAGAAVPAGEYTLTPINDTGPGACRAATLAWNPTIRPESYDLVLKAVDWLGRDVQVTLAVRVDMGLYSGERRLGSGETLPADAPFQVRLTTPVAVEATDLEVLVNGLGGYFTFAATDAGNRAWVGTLRQALPVGEVAFTTKVRNVTVGDPVTLDIDGTPELALRDVYFYPSPWSGQGTGRFLYNLNFGAADRPSRVRINVYAVSGRKVTTLEGPAELGPNQIEWDLTDREGDVVANGVYIFRLAVEGVPAGKLDAVDKLVVHR